MLESLKKLEDAQAAIELEKKEMEAELLGYEIETKKLIKEKSIEHSNYLETYQNDLEKEKKSIYEQDVAELEKRTREQLAHMEQIAESEIGNLAAVILEEVEAEYGSF